MATEAGNMKEFYDLWESAWSHFTQLILFLRSISIEGSHAMITWDCQGLMYYETGRWP